MLQEHGYTVIPAFKDDALRQEFINTCQSFPEYKSHEQLVLGNFAALGNPASFHNPFVRKMRLRSMEIVRAANVIPMVSEKHKLAQIIDRMMYRKRGLKPTAESWHRDEAKHTNPDDVVYGGWINLDPTPQYFSCIPGTHRVAKTHHGGFAKVDPKTIDTRGKKKIEIKPGHILIFNEDLIHEVLSTPSKNDMCRLFLGWLVTTSDDTIIPDIEHILRVQAVVPLKSGQVPPMYAKLHWTNWHQRLVAFSENFHESCIESKKRKEDTVRVVHRNMKSLRDLGYMYPPYMQDEIDILIPH